MVSVGVVTSADQMKDNFVGKPGKDISLTIVDDSNNPVAANEQGLILLKCRYLKQLFQEERERERDRIKVYSSSIRSIFQIKSESFF